MPTLLAIALTAVLAGCTSTHEPVELASIEPQSQYDQRIQDGLGSQKYTESQILYMRRLNEFKDQIDSLEKQKQALEASLSTTAYEQDLGSGKAPSTESSRIEEFKRQPRPHRPGLLKRIQRRPYASPSLRMTVTAPYSRLRIEQWLRLSS
ncbi:hypothetical protein P4126_31880 [Pseudomonas aeruginosa]|nr:hypothetical protein [Pseudomonas aeruginosa]